MVEQDTVIAKSLEEIMRTKKVSVAELSQGTGVPVQSIYYYLKKKTKQVDLGILHQLADYLQVGMEYFLDPAGYQEPIILTDAEALLLTTYRGMNEQGREKASEYLADLGGNPKFTKK